MYIHFISNFLQSFFFLISEVASMLINLILTDFFYTFTDNVLQHRP